MPQKTAAKTTRSKKSSAKTSSSSSSSSKSTALKSAPQSQAKSSGLMTPFLIVCIIFAGFIGYYVADQRAIIELHKVVSQCQQSFKY